MSPLDVTQAVLVVDPKRDHDQADQRLALFDEVTGEPYPFSGEPWKTVTDDQMQNSWHSFVWQGYTYPTQYRKRPNGHVELRGLIGVGTTGVAFTLPEGYRHTYPGSLNFLVATNDAYGTLAVMPNGDILVMNTRDAHWFSLASVMFSVT